MSPQGRKVLDLGLPLDPPRIFAAIHPRAHRRRLVIRADSIPHSLTSLQPRTSASASVVRCGTRQPAGRPTTRATTVSDSYPPTLHPGRRVRSLGAALAGGSPQSSPSPSSSDRLSPLGGPILEFVPPLTVLSPQQASGRRGATSPPPIASTSGIRATAGPTLEEVGLDASPPLTPIREVEMESSTQRDLARALRDIAARLPVPRDGLERAVDEAKVKINAATSDGGVVVVLPHQFRSDSLEYLKRYHSEVESLAKARSSLAKLRKHRSAKTYPPSLSSLKSPAIQFSHAFVNAPAAEGNRGAYSIAAGSAPAAFEQAVELAVKSLRDEVLKHWISEKSKEVTFLEQKASAAEAIGAFEQVIATKHLQLKARWDYLSGTDSYDKIIGDIDAHAALSHALAQSIITKVTAMVLDAEEDRLNVAFKKIVLEKPAVLAGSQASTNDISELKKLVGNLAKKVDLQSKKVHDGLFHLLCYCGGHLSLTHPLLESLLVGLVQAGWEEVGRRQEV